MVTEDQSGYYIIEKNRNVKITVSLRDADGNEADIKEVVQGLTETIVEAFETEEHNEIKNQVFPLIGAATSITLSEIYSTSFASAIMTDDSLREGFMHTATMGFFLLKLLQNLGLTINIEEEAITDEEIERLDRLEGAQAMLIHFASRGMPPSVTLQALLEKELLKPEDVEALGLNSIIEEVEGNEEEDDEDETE